LKFLKVSTSILTAKGRYAVQQEKLAQVLIFLQGSIPITCDKIPNSPNLKVRHKSSEYSWCDVWNEKYLGD
jgi:hypothetical protein